MNETKNESIVGKRPIIITTICVLGLFGLAMVLLGLLNPSARTDMIQQGGTMIIPITVLVLILGLAGFIGYWNMRKWGVYLYSVMAIISIGSGIFSNLQTGIIPYIMPIVVIGIGIIYFNRMT